MEFDEKNPNPMNRRRYAAACQNPNKMTCMLINRSWNFVIRSWKNHGNLSDNFLATQHSAFNSPRSVWNPYDKQELNR